MTEAVWESLSATHPVGTEDLERNTPLYIDVSIAWELGMRYPDYITKTTPQERLLYQLFLALRNAKEEYAHTKTQAEAEIAREMSQPGGPPVRP